jgi:hypothetical protein
MNISTEVEKAFDIKCVHMYVNAKLLKPLWEWGGDGEFQCDTFDTLLGRSSVP